MVTREDLENFLIGNDLDYEEVAEGMYLVRNDSDGLPVVVNHSPPLLIVRMKIMDLPERGGNRAELYRTLLELNASDVVHGAYALEGDELVLSNTLPLESLDYPLLQASVESLVMAASSHLARIKSLASEPVEG